MGGCLLPCPEDADVLRTPEEPVHPEVHILAGPEWLARRLDDQTVRAVDLRDQEAYLAGHVPGAFHLDLEDLGNHIDGRDNMMLSAAEFGSAMGRLGITNSDIVVAYDDHWGLPSARLVWALHYFGHRAAVVLNGGWDRWEQEGLPISGSSAPREGGLFQARANPEVHADYEWISRHLDREDVVLLDTRTRVEFDQGHLPRATSWDWFNAIPVESWDCSREPDVLQAELATLGVHASDEIVVYCRSGMRAAHTYVVLRHLGFPRVRLYDGSWQDWSAR